MPQPRQAIDFSGRSLSELAVLTQEGHQEAFRHIMQRCNQRLFRTARAVLNDDDEAEDALQEAYVNAFRHIDTFRGEAELTTWLTRITLNECHRRLRKRRPTVELGQVGAQTLSRVVNFPTRFGMDDPAQDATRAQIRELIERAVAALPEKFRVVFMLRDVEGCGTEETANILGIRPETVKTRLFRARHKLRKKLHEQLSDSLEGAFPFLGAHCSRLTDTVMLRLDATQFHHKGDH